MVSAVCLVVRFGRRPKTWIIKYDKEKLIKLQGTERPYSLRTKYWSTIDQGALLRALLKSSISRKEKEKMLEESSQTSKRLSFKPQDLRTQDLVRGSRRIFFEMILPTKSRLETPREGSASVLVRFQVHTCRQMMRL